MVVFSEAPGLRVRLRCALIEAMFVLIVAAIAVIPSVRQKGAVASHR